MDRDVGAAARLPGSDRKDLAIQALAGSGTVSDLAARHGVSRKFVYQQTHKARAALDDAFSSATPHAPRHRRSPRARGLRAAPLAQHLARVLARVEPATRAAGRQVPHPIRRREPGHGGHASQQLAGGEPQLAAAHLLHPAPSPRGPSQDWGCDGQLGIFAFVLWPRVDAWLGC